MINKPHAHILGGGEPGKLYPTLLEFKRRMDPQGLLDPGKMRSWPAAPTE